MDSMRHENDPWLRVWRVVAGGDEATGMTKLMVILALFVLVFGSFFALVTA